METEENHHTCKRSRVGNGGGGPVHQDEDEEDGEGKGGGSGRGRGRGGLRHWHHHSSRIFRVSRASGGKDRHSKVYTAKGLRDRRVRLSVSTAIQFYDLQDRLGYDQPSKAIEWLINSAAAAIAELPMLESSFLDPPKLHLLQAKPEIEFEAEPSNGSQQQHCSSASETSKGSVFYLPRSDSRVKARERARERAAKDKEKDSVSHVAAPQSLNSQSSFTELLTGSGTTAAQVNPSSNCVQKQIRYLPVAATADYFTQAGLFGQAQKAHQQPFGFNSQTHVGNSSPMGMLPFNIAVAAAAAAAAADHPEMHQFSFLQDHPVPVPAAVAGGDYNLNFSISSCLAGFNRGTLQSNSPSQLPHHHHHHLQRVSSPVDGSNLPFFFGAAPSAAAATSAEDHFPAGLDGRLQLYYDDEHRHSDLKGKGKS